MGLRIFILFISSLFCLTACSQQNTKKEKTESKPVYELLGPVDFQKRIKDQPGILLDVRTPSEQNKGIIQNAKSMDIFGDNFEAEIDKLDKNTTYYVYCAAGGRSLEACELMQKKGFQHVVDLDGGFSRWRNEGLPVSGPIK